MVPWGRDRHEPRRTRADTHASDHFRHTSSAQCPSSNGAVAVTGRRHGGRARGRPVELRLLAEAGLGGPEGRWPRHHGACTGTPDYWGDAALLFPLYWPRSRTLLPPWVLPGT